MFKSKEYTPAQEKLIRKAYKRIAKTLINTIEENQTKEMPFCGGLGMIAPSQLAEIKEQFQNSELNKQLINTGRSISSQSFEIMAFDAWLFVNTQRAEDQPVRSHWDLSKHIRAEYRGMHWASYHSAST